LNATASDVFLARFNSSGAHLASTAFVATGDQTGLSVRYDSAGLLLAGVYSSPMDFGGGALPAFGNKDLYIASLELGGVHRWSKGFGTSGNDARCEAEVDAQGSVVLGATATTGITFGGPASTGTFHIAKLEGQPGALDTPASPSSSTRELTAAPNPFASGTVLLLDRSMDVRSLAIFDLSGRRVRTFGSIRNLDVLSWDGVTDAGVAAVPGIYWAELETSTGRIRTRLVRVP
jgi:hypothetical protein